MNLANSHNPRSPDPRQPNQINTPDGGHGVYFYDPSGSILEIITRPYGDER